MMLTTDVKDKIILSRPVYTDVGNVTELLINNKGQTGTAIDYRNITSVRQAVARSFALDLTAQAKIIKGRLLEAVNILFNKLNKIEQISEKVF